MRVLVGDVGGTKTRLALFETDAGPLRKTREGTYPSGEYSGLEAIAERFLESQGHPRCDRACFGIAGPVSRGSSRTTNLPWLIDASRLSTSLGIRRVELLNDLEAVAYSIELLEAGDLLSLNTGDPEATGNRAVIAAGTGLGQAGLYWDGCRHRPFATEGGHAGFAPADDLQVALLQHLRQRFDHVSWERVLSGPALVDIYQFLLQHRRAKEPAWLGAEMREADPAAAISRAALRGSDETCAEALDLFVSFYGAEAGNLALKLMATGGVFVGGGIAPKIAEKLEDSTFMRSFCAKGRFRRLMESMPVKVILSDKAALLGAASHVSLDRD